MTSQEPNPPQNADNRAPDTQVIAVETPAPVFVDSTGRRGRLLRRLALAFGIVVVSYGGVLSVSLAGGPVSSSAVLPLPGLDDDKAEETAEVKPSPSPTPAPSGTAAQRYIIESLNKQAGARPRTTAPSGSAKPTGKATSKPAATKSATPKPSATKSASPSASTSHTPESTGTTKPSPSVSSSAPDTSGTAGGEVVESTAIAEPLPPLVIIITPTTDAPTTDAPTADIPTDIPAAEPTETEPTETEGLV
ncbi:hypothetical protein [Actinoplanes sp. NPDC051851]|uniref:hypothetical protein n=1 Tax=Actinoplanes sp. NPDC051851 TaxID=3154753 RepID=UPI003427051B